MPTALASSRIAVLTTLIAVAAWSTCAQAQSEVLVQHRVVEGPPSAPVYRWRGFHVQPRLMATFGINASHEFGQACPGDRCSVQLPLGAAAGVFAGYSWNDTSVHLLLLGLVDYSRADRDDARAARSDGDAEVNADGGFDIDIGLGGISIDAGVGSSGSGARSRNTADAGPQPMHLLRVGTAFGVGVQQAWLQRPARLTTGLSVGAIRRSLYGRSDDDEQSLAYTTPFVMGDIGFQLGKRSTALLGLFALAEFAAPQSFANLGQYRDTDVVSGTQVYVGPYFAFQFGPTRRVVRKP